MCGKSDFSLTHTPNDLLLSKKKTVHELLVQKEQIKLLVATPTDQKSLVDTFTYTEILAIFESSRASFSFSNEFQCLVAFFFFFNGRIIAQAYEYRSHST